MHEEGFRQGEESVLGKWGPVSSHPGGWERGESCLIHKHQFSLQLAFDGRLLPKVVFMSFSEMGPDLQGGFSGSRPGQATPARWLVLLEGFSCLSSAFLGKETPSSSLFPDCQRKGPSSAFCIPHLLCSRLCARYWAHRDVKMV